ncbi:MAG: cobalamin-binding protein [Planctomycetes bacterium]|nr:cobalamin-binding protein [Planctomycetota bacterium]
MIPPPAQRIASLLAGSTEILCGLGLRDRIVAISHECDFPPEITDRPRVTFSRIASDANSHAIDDQVKRMSASGESLYGIDAETLIALHPDLIVTQSQCDVCAVRHADVVSLVQSSSALANAGIVAMNPSRLDDLFDDIGRIAGTAGLPDKGSAYIAALRSRLDDVVRKFETRPRPRVACIEWIEPLMIAANWMPDLIERAGGRCDLTKAGEHSRYSDWPDLTRSDPDVLIVSPCGFDLQLTLDEAKVLFRRVEWSTLSAVRSKRVFAVDGNAYFNRSGPRLVDSVELLSSLLHDDAIPTGAPAVRLS